MPRRSRSAGQTRDAGFQAGARRTLAVTPARAWAFLVSPAGAATWLGDTGGAAVAQGTRLALPDGSSAEVTVFEPGSHLRMRWQPGDWPRASIMQLRVIASGERATVAFHQEHLPGPDEREQRLQHFADALDRIEAALET